MCALKVSTDFSVDYVITMYTARTRPVLWLLRNSRTDNGAKENPWGEHEKNRRTDERKKFFCATIRMCARRPLQRVHNCWRKFSLLERRCSKDQGESFPTVKVTYKKKITASPSRLFPKKEKSLFERNILQTRNSSHKDICLNESSSQERSIQLESLHRKSFFHSSL